MTHFVYLKTVVDIFNNILKGETPIKGFDISIFEKINKLRPMFTRNGFSKMWLPSATHLSSLYTYLVFRRCDTRVMSYKWFSKRNRIMILGIPFFLIFTSANPPHQEFFNITVCVCS